MKTIHSLFVCLLYLSCLSAQNKPKINLSFFGSSVCQGTGAKDDKGYAWQFYNRNVIDTTKYKYHNASTGGDNTIKVEKFDRLTNKLYPTNPDFVVLGLSLGNEGIRNAIDENGMEQILEQYRSRLLKLADSLNSQDMKPIIVNCYAHSFFNEAHYKYTKEINEIINTWPYPSINVLGTIDDYKGKWVKGYVNDPWHPNFEGHKEMSFAIVPTLFEAILMGKKTPFYDWNPSYITLKNKKEVNKPLAIMVKDTIHSFTMSFRFKKTENGSIAGFSANELEHTIDVEKFNLKYKNISIPFERHLDKWNHVVLSHSYANQKTHLYLNGNLLGEVEERLSPTQVYFGGTSKSVELKDIALHRSAINADEVLHLFNKKFIQSSLEFYNPMTKIFNKNQLDNKAQSLTEIKIDSSQQLIENSIGF